MKSENEIEQRLQRLEESHSPHVDTSDCDTCAEIDILRWVLDKEEPEQNAARMEDWDT